MPDEITNALLSANELDEERISPRGDDYQFVGELVGQWIGEQFPTLDEQNDPQFQAQIRAQIEVALGRPGGPKPLPSRIKRIYVIQEHKDTLHIMVPPREAYNKGLRDAQAREAANLPYELYGEYDRQVRDLRGRKPASKFFDFRVGEYCLGQCK